MKDKINKIYSISRFLITLLAFIIFLIMIQSEDTSWLFIPFLFAGITYGLTYPSTYISKKIIEYGDKKKNLSSKILYYLGLPIVMFIVFLAAYYIIITFASGLHAETLAEGLGIALICLFIIAVTTIVIVLPYVQTIIVIILRRIRGI